MNIGRNANSHLSSPNISTPQMGNSFSNSELVQKIRDVRIKGNLTNRDMSGLFFHNTAGGGGGGVGVSTVD